MTIVLKSQKIKHKVRSIMIKHIKVSNNNERAELVKRE